MAAFKFLTCGKCLLIAAAISIIGGLVFLYSGLYPIGADVPHNRLSYWLLETLRERSIARSASDIEAELTMTVPKTISAIRAANDGASTL